MNRAPQVPFLDLVAPHHELGNELVEIFKTALNTAGFIGGPMVEEFERAFAGFCNAAHCIGTSNGTDALTLALIAAGVKPGDAVITVPNTFIATVEAISHAGGVAKFVDVDERTYNMDAEKLREFLETRCVMDGDSGRVITHDDRRPVTSIIPVHLYGQMADMDAICDLAERYNLIVIEDACQAHGAEYFSHRKGRWIKAGSIGCAAAFSFYPGKNLGACGEAGAVTSNDSSVAAKIRMLRDHGQAKKYYHDLEGYNARLDALQAGILSLKLKHLDRWNESRRNHAGKYNELFADMGAAVVTPYEPPWSKAVYHLYVVRVDDRKAVQAALARERIGTGIHYPIPLHLQKAYVGLGYRGGDLPVSESLARQILSLPMFPQMTPLQQARVADNLVKSTGTKVLEAGVTAR
jgi:dTDP-4-amino-4,6-dideoxygalactose transaminase